MCIRDSDKSIIINQVYDAIALNQSSTSRDIEISLKARGRHNVDCYVQTIFFNKDKHVLLEMRAQKRIKNIVENAKFVNQNNATEQITRSIAHEIKNPLGGIKGAAQLLKKEIKEEHKEKGMEGRYGAGLPSVDDGQLLFLQLATASLSR